MRDKNMNFYLIIRCTNHWAREIHVWLILSLSGSVILQPQQFLQQRGCACTTWATAQHIQRCLVTTSPKGDNI